jgi:hypothetical protein
MYFSLVDFCFRNDIKMVGLLSISLMPKEHGTRHLIAFQLFQNNKGWGYNVHAFWFVNYSWYSSGFKQAHACGVSTSEVDA